MENSNSSAIYHVSCKKCMHQFHIDLLAIPQVDELLVRFTNEREAKEKIEKELVNVRQKLIDELAKNALTPTGIQRLETAESQLSAPRSSPVCSCRVDALEPNPYCPIHGGERKPAAEKESNDLCGGHGGTMDATGLADLDSAIDAFSELA